ncbi:hypothetical protein IQ247_09765 [Plectonema cf. radiosum LEGE 06105]|uniref:Uncharacterized protein n=1 Tax=Plectonema cf. radiosum LEGE 06105 TaxID=945769 RepID=A0A8J7EZR1_9CYAN|nr:hypothetical protein [Plectonema radiosum]MBE9212968.1 hypothetical protein [Plectonema cf. radiosum LEGE 06105]
MSKFIKRIQSSLSREGIKKTSAEIREELNAIASDPSNPSLDDIKEVKESLSRQSSQITEVEEEETKDIGHVNLSKRDEDEEPMQDESKGEITFTNNFEKAGAIQEAFTANGITATDIEVMGISGEIESKFEDHKTFIVEALKAWRNYQVQNGEQQADEISEVLADIRADAANFTNRTNASMTATANYINELRAKQRQEFMAFIERVKTN